MEQQIYLIGLNYRTAGVEVRERFALTDHCSKDTWAIPLRPSGENDSAETTLDEALILSTCNRVEILAVGQGDVPGLILEAWASAKNRKAVELAPYVYIHKGREAIAHLFTVASSLDSMVLGEPQILGQLKGAYRKATLAGTTKTIINRLLHKSFSVAKRVRTETGIAASAVSISYAAVELAKRIFGDMGQYQAMLIGAGEMAELAATHLIQAGISNVKVANRTYQRAKELAAAARLGGELHHALLELLRRGLRLGLQPGLLRLAGFLLEIHGVDGVGRGGDGQLPGQKKVPGIAFAHLYQLALLALAPHVLL